MKVNILNNCLAGFTGSETWAYTMAKYLSREHDVTVVTPGLGVLSDMMDFCEVSDIWVDCDLAICNHLHQLVPKTTPMIYTSHSVFYDIEKFPDRDCIKAAPSKEIAEPNGAHLIHQPIDLERFKPTKINKTPKKILYFVHPDYAKDREIVEEAFPDHGLIFIDEPIFNVENVIRDADIVITTGRGCYEALAMGKNVICADNRNNKDSFMGVGMITEDNFEFLLEANLSGRNVRTSFTPETLRQELDKYNSDRKIDMSRFDAGLIAKQYIELWTNTRKDI